MDDVLYILCRADYCFDEDRIVVCKALTSPVAMEFDLAYQLERLVAVGCSLNRALLLSLIARKLKGLCDDYRPRSMNFKAYTLFAVVS